MFTSRLRVALALVLALVAAGCGSPPAPTDASPAMPDGGAPCVTDGDCDDGLFCNGPERCAESRCVRGTPVVCDDTVACTRDVCSETARACQARVPDEDGDGHGDARCLDATGQALGDDCDESDADRFPGNAERCDVLAHDEDCDPTTHGARDHDGDGYEDVECCNDAACGDDCDDAHASAHPGGTEACNRLDDDCDGTIDEEASAPGFVDADRDGRGDATMPTSACITRDGFSVYGDDCDDTTPARSPAQPELCDLVDNDCDGNVDESAGAVPWYVDADGDSFGDPRAPTFSSCVPPSGYVLLGTDCDDTVAGRNPLSTERCNGIDDDCDGAPDYEIAPGDLEDDDLDGVPDAACGAAIRDCDDRDASTGPGRAESCDGRDNDCDGRIDEAVTSVVFYRDADGDGFGTLASVMPSCSAPTGYVARGGDCDDADASRHPLLVEGCDGVDEDCDGATDEGASTSCGPHVRGACVDGACRALGCDLGWGDCTAAPGCETNLATSVVSCGRCGQTCRGTCASGVCTAPGFSTSGLVVWLDAADAALSTLANGAPVTSWPNRAGGADLVAFDAAPTYRAQSSFSPSPSVTFGGGGLRTTTDLFDTRAHAIFVVASLTDTAEDDLVGTDLYIGPTGEALLMSYSSRVRTHLWGASSLTYLDSPVAVAARVPHLFVQTSDGVTLGQRFDGVATGSAAIGGGAASSLQPVLVGSRCASCYPSGRADGEIAEVLVFARALSAAEITSVELYLRTRWGL